MSGDESARESLGARAARGAAEVARLAARAGVRIAVAESLTGGSLAARIAAEKGASEWFSGGVVAYARDVKHALLGVPEGPVVSAAAASAMAEGARRLLSADVAVALTGVAGPKTQDGRPVGTVFVGLARAGRGTRAEERRFSGGPEEVVEASLVHAIELLARALRAP